MEGFTVVLMIAWLILMAVFGGMYFMDQAIKKAEGSGDTRSARG